MARLPLEGIRVTCITPIWAGPFAAQLFADWGAEVIVVESGHHWQPATRGTLAHPPQFMVEQEVGGLMAYCRKDATGRGWDRSCLFNPHARNKLSMTVDLRRPEGVDVFKRLIAKSDVFLESNAAGTMDKMGIGYDELKKVKPDLVMFSIPGMGSTGPKRHYVGFGAHMEGLFGHTYLRGYHDADPQTNTIVFHYDPAVGATVAFATMMALHHRNKTGEGIYVDMAGAEASMPQLGEVIMDYTMNGRVAERIGNRHPTATQGCYLCKGARPSAETTAGDDKWLNITINTDDEWAALCRVMGRPDLVHDERFADSLSRRAHQDEFDRVVGEWTRGHDKYALMHMLQAEGVPAGAVLDQRDCYNDPHILERGFFEELTQEECGTHLYPGIAWKMSKTPNHLRTPPCMLGEHNEYVYKQIIGVSDEEYAQMELNGHIHMDFDDDIM